MSKTLKEMIAVMQEADKGAEIERMRCWPKRGKWEIDTAPQWDWGVNDYRVATKPEPDWERIHKALFRHGGVVRDRTTGKEFRVTEHINKAAEHYYSFLEDYEYLANSKDWHPCSEYPLL